MKVALLVFLGVIFLACLFLWLITRIRYRVGRKHVKVLLFGIPLRRISIAHITYASKREPEGMAERWYNTLNISHRLLTIQKRSGIFRNVCISPKNRYEFLGEIKSAVRRIDPKAEWAQVPTFEESAAILSDANSSPPKK